MRTVEAYNNWAESYDQVENPTRSLDEKVVRNLLTVLDGIDIIEAGCGTGKNSAWFSQKCRSLKSFDFSNEMLKIAKGKVKNNNTEFINHDVTEPWPFGNNSCDLVSINLILEHIENIDFIFEESYRILRDNRKLFVSELHPLKQKEGSVARFVDIKTEKEIRLVSYYHSKDNFTEAGELAGFSQIEMKDWYDDTNNDIPRLLSILLTK